MGGLPPRLPLRLRMLPFPRPRNGAVWSRRSLRQLWRHHLQFVRRWRARRNARSAWMALLRILCYHADTGACVVTALDWWTVAPSAVVTFSSEFKFVTALGESCEARVLEFFVPARMYAALSVPRRTVSGEPALIRRLQPQ